MATVYLETSFVSALVTDRADVASLYRREVSQLWWDTQRGFHDLFVSEEVIGELSAPGYARSPLALKQVASVTVLAVTAEVRALAAVLAREKVVPQALAGDAVHVAIVARYGLEYMLSWNVRHLANPNKMEHLRAICRRVGLATPRLITPELLWEADNA